MKAKQALRTLLQPHQMEVIELDQMGGRPAGDGGDIDPDAVQDALKKVIGRVFQVEVRYSMPRPGGMSLCRQASSNKRYLLPLRHAVLSGSLSNAPVGRN